MPTSTTPTTPEPTASPETTTPPRLRVGFIGAGRVARILADGWALSGVTPDEVTAFDPDPEALARLTTSHPWITAGSRESAAAADVVFVGVHPPVARDVFAGLKGLLGPRSLLVSLVPGTRLDRLAELVGASQAAARVIPNAPSVAGKGFNPVAFNGAATERDRLALTSLLSRIGSSPEVSDYHLEAYAILTAMGPTYLWPQFYALLDVAADMGLAEDDAADALAAMVMGALATMRTGASDRDHVLDLIPSKPMAEQVSAVSAAYASVLLPLHARLSGGA